MTLKYFDISWFSSVDGPGTRVVLFLQGCHLRCPWCHSPQSWHAKSPMFFFESRCNLCGACVAACPNDAHNIRDGKHLLERDLCEGCGACIESCPVSRADRWNTGALGFPGSEMEAPDMFRLLEPQLEMLRNIGGLTLSGGEPLLQADELPELLSLCTDANIHTALETSLTLPREAFELLLDQVDLWLVGLRPAVLKDGDKEKKRLGDWGAVMKNLEFLAARCRDDIIIRTPVIPGYTDDRECLKIIGDAMTANHLSTIELLPYNPYSGHYYEAGGISYPLKETKQAGESKMNRICAYFSGRGFSARIVK